MFLLPKSYWEIKETATKGRGVFAKKDFRPGTVIGDYLGKLIDSDEDSKYEEEYGFYLMYYTDDITIFPSVKEPGIHLLNHSCTPNCWMYTYKGHTLYFALRKIYKGEELTVSYQVDPHDKDCGEPCMLTCHCGSFVCKKTMHLSQESYDKWDKADEEITKKTKKQQVKIGTELPKLKTYPATIPDHPVYTLFGSNLKKPISYQDSTIPSIPEIRRRIRETGQFLQFPKLKSIVYGIMDEVLVTDKK